MRSCSATSQTMVRLPARAAARPSAAATVVLPTPPLPVTNTSRLSRTSSMSPCSVRAGGQRGSVTGSCTCSGWVTHSARPSSTADALPRSIRRDSCGSEAASASRTSTAVARLAHDPPVGGLRVASDPHGAPVRGPERRRRAKPLEPAQLAAHLGAAAGEAFHGHLEPGRPTDSATASSAISRQSRVGALPVLGCRGDRRRVALGALVVLAVGEVAGGEGQRAGEQHGVGGAQHTPKVPTRAGRNSRRMCE